MGWVTELWSFFISRQKMTSVHAINHTTVSSKFHSLNEITWELEHGAPSRAKSHTLSSKTRPARKHPPNQCTQTDTHSYTHTVKAVSLSPSMALCSLQQNHLITRQIQSVITAHTDWGLHTFLFLCDTGYSADGAPQTTCATACVFLCVSWCLAPSRDGRAWRSTGTRLHGSDQ